MCKGLAMYDAPEPDTLTGGKGLGGIFGWERVLFWWRGLQPDNSDQWNEFYFPDGDLNNELAAGREVIGMLSNPPDWANGHEGPGFMSVWPARF